MDNLARVLTFPEKPSPENHPDAEKFAAVMRVWLPARLAKSTHAMYHTALGLFLRSAGQNELLGALADEQTALKSLRQFMDEIEGLAPATRRLYLTALRKLVLACEDCGLIDFTIHQYIDRPSKAQEFLYPDDLPTREQCLSAIASEKDPACAWAFSLLYYMALRTSEVCGLRWEQLKVVGGVLAFEITGKGKTSLVRVPGPLVQAMTEKAQAAGRTGLVCPAADGVPFTRLRLFRACRRAWKSVGYVHENAVGEGGHLWRHCHASHAIAAGLARGLSLAEIRETVRVSMRHSSVRTQDLYVHVAPPSSGDLLGEIELPGQ